MNKIVFMYNGRMVATSNLNFIPRVGEFVYVGNRMHKVKTVVYNLDAISQNPNNYCISIELTA